LKGMSAYIGRFKKIPERMRTDLIIIKDNKVEFTYEDIKAAMEESKRKLEGNTISRENFDRVFYRVLHESIAEGNQLEQYNEGVRAVLAAVIGLGSVGLLYNVNAINRELQKRPESPSQKVQAIQQVDQQLDSEEFHRVATDVINRIVQEPSEQPKPQAAQPQLAQSKEKPATKEDKKETKKEKEEPPISVKDMGNIYDTIANYILPSEIIGTSIEAKVNDRFMKPYKDDVGKWTIGVGHLIGDGSLEAKKARDKARAKKGLSSTLSPEEALSLFNQDVSKRIPQVEEKFKELWPTMSTGLKAALVDIEYRGDMKSKGEGEFEWVELLKKGEYKEASQKYLDHKEYKKRIKKNPKGDGVVKRMKRNARIIAAEEPADKLASS